MADLIHGLPHPSTGVVYYGEHRYDLWLPKEEVITMEGITEHDIAHALMDRDVRTGSMHIDTTDQPEGRPMSISGRLANILDCLNGGCKAMEAIVGTPEGAKCQEAVEPASRVENLEQFVETIEYRVGELLSQIDRLAGRLG